jgi:hypothetical protein
VRGDVLGKVLLTAALNLENGTYVRQQQQIGEIYTKHGATAANW